MVITRRTAIASAGAALAAGPVAAKGRALITVRARPGAINGALTCNGKSYLCAVGRSGIVRHKFEGDGGTPTGVFGLREVRYRPDRIGKPPVTALPVYPSKANDGWCDDPADPNYNRLVPLPYQTDAESMWFDSPAYDLLAVIGYNDSPTVAGAGSAIFLHVAHGLPEGYGSTAGCVALKMEDLVEVLDVCASGSRIDIRQG